MNADMSSSFGRGNHGLKPVDDVMRKIKNNTWVPTPTFLYRNYLYRKLCVFLKKNSYFLEVGSGNGEFLKFLTEKGFQGELIDNSDAVVNFLNLQKDKLRGITIKKDDILNYRVKRKYDAVFCFEVLEHIKDYNRAIKNISGLLKPGGFFFFSVPAHQREWSIRDEAQGHYRRFERKELVDKLQTNHFKIVKILNYGFPLLTLVRMITSKGKLIKLQKRNLAKTTRTGLSSLHQEYDPKIKFIVANPFLLFPLFKIMDLFLSFDLGFGYIFLARKV